MSKIPEYKVTEEDNDGKMYELLEPIRYLSTRYGKVVSADRGYRSDGASGAFDIRSLGWWVHDVLCDRGTWDDGSPCTNWQASTVLADILRSEGRMTRSVYWWIATWTLGGGKARENGML
jgi:hypothetical protein